MGSMLLSTLTTTAAAAVLLQNPTSDAPAVTLKNGSYYGVHLTSYNQDYFLGMPFAQPPVDDLRLRQP